MNISKAIGYAAMMIAIIVMNYISTWIGFESVVIGLLTMILLCILLLNKDQRHND